MSEISKSELEKRAKAEIEMAEKQIDAFEENPGRHGQYDFWRGKRNSAMSLLNTLNGLNNSFGGDYDD